MIVGPSNPVISIGPMLALPGMRDALRACPGPVVAVSPLVGGRSLKGPTEAFLAWAGRAADAATGSRAYYDGLLDGLVADERTDALPTLETDVAMPDAAGRAGASRDEALRFALALGGLAFGAACAPPPSCPSSPSAAPSSASTPRSRQPDAGGPRRGDGRRRARGAGRACAGSTT